MRLRAWYRYQVRLAREVAATTRYMRDQGWKQRWYGPWVHPDHGTFPNCNEAMKAQTGCSLYDPEVRFIWGRYDPHLRKPEEARQK